MHLRVVGVHLAASLIDGHEHGFYSARGLRHERCGACGCYREACDVASSVLGHLLIELGVGLTYACYHGVVLLALRVVDCECSALACHLHAAAVGREAQRLLHLHGEVRGLLCAVAQSECRQHVAFGRDAYARAAAHAALAKYLLPEVSFALLHLLALRVGIDFVEDEAYLLQLKVYDVIHDALCPPDVVAEEVEVESCVARERFAYVAVEVDGQQPT